MALAKSAIAVRFTGGIETKADPKTVPTTKLLTLENGVFTRATSIVKRNGYEALTRAVDGNPAPFTGAQRLAKRDEELLAFSRDRCYSRSADAARWSDAGAVFSVVGRDAPLVRTGTEQTMPDHATARGVRVVAWEDSRGGVWWTTIDAASGRVLRAPALLRLDAERPRCLAVGDVLHIYVAIPTLNRIDVAIVNPSAPSADATLRTVIEDLDGVYDACTTGRAGAPALIGWREDSAGRVRIGYVTAGGVVGAVGTGLPAVFDETADMTPTSPLAVAWSSTEVAAAWEETAGTVRLSTYTTELVELVHTNAIFIADPARIALTYTTPGHVWIAVEGDADEPTERLCKVADSIAANASGARELRSVGLASRAFAVDGDAFTTFVHDAQYFGIYLTYRLSDFAIVARQLAGLAAGAPPHSHLSSVQVDGDTARTALAYRERLVTEGTARFAETGIRFLEFDFDSEDSHGATQLGRGLYLAGACPQHYDGRGWTEQGFHVGPELIDVVGATDGGTPLTREYRAWYEWTDAQGEVHRGPTSIGSTVVSTEAGATLTLPTLRVTAKVNARICVARTLGNDDTQFFRVTSSDPNTAGQPNGYVANDPTVDSVTFVDTMVDDDLRKLGEPLYTNGGILSNDPAALGPVIAGGKGRLFFTDTSDPNKVRFSQPIEDGYGLEVPPDLVVPCDPFGGAITGLAVMDDVVVVFKKHAIFAFNGDGPSANGDTADAGFSVPQLLASDVGCTDPNSIALTPPGLVFKTSKGIYLLDRGRAVSPIGAPVEAYNAQAVRRATVMPDRTQIVFLTDAGLTLLWDFERNQWSTFTRHEGYDAAIVGGRYHYLALDGRVMRETPGAYSDAGRSIRLRFETAWIHLTEQLQGWQRFYHLHVLGERKSPHQLRVQWRTDYGSSEWCDPMFLDATGDADPDGWVTGDRAGVIGLDPITGSSYGQGAYGAGPYGGSAPQLYQWRAHLGLKGQAIQFRFDDVERAGQPGASFELTELLITGGVKGPAKKPFSAARST